MGLPRFLYLGNSLQSSKLSLLLRPPPTGAEARGGGSHAGAPGARGAALDLVTTGATTALNTRGRARSSSFSAAIMPRTSPAA